MMLNSPYKVKHVFPSGPVSIGYDGWGNVTEYIDPRDMVENKFQGSNPLEFFLFFFCCMCAKTGNSNITPPQADRLNETTPVSKTNTNLLLQYGLLTKLYNYGK